MGRDGHHIGLVEIFPKPAQVTRSLPAWSGDLRKIRETIKMFGPRKAEPERGDRGWRAKKSEHIGETKAMASLWCVRPPG